MVPVWCHFLSRWGDAREHHMVRFRCFVDGLHLSCICETFLYFETFLAFGQFKVLSWPLLARGFRENWGCSDFRHNMAPSNLSHSFGFSHCLTEPVLFSALCRPHFHRADKDLARQIFRLAFLSPCMSSSEWPTACWQIVSQCDHCTSDAVPMEQLLTFASTSRLSRKPNRSICQVRRDKKREDDRRRDRRYVYIYI